MKKVKFLFGIAGTALLLASCSASNKLNRRLQGSWDIASFKEQHIGKTEAAASNIGTMTFSDDNTGSKKITYRILQNHIADTSRFTWNNTGKTVTVRSENSPFAKTWIVIKNKRKSQVWKSTDGKGNVQSIVLKK